MLESNKKELQFNINSFNLPAESSGPKAWIRLVINLLFLIKGTYISEPDMGIGIQNYEYYILDDLKDEIEGEITNQIRTYLPDIPFNSVTVGEMNDNIVNALLLIFNFVDDGSSETVVVAIDKSNNTPHINFEVAM